MGSFNIPMPGVEHSMSDLLSRVPRQFREQAEKGFAILATVSPHHYAEVLRAAVATLESRQPALEELQKALELSQNDISLLFAAAMLTVPVVGQSGGDSSSEFIAAAVRARIIPEGAAEKVRPFVETVVAERTHITRAIRRAALPRQLLPSLSNVEMLVDLRMLFDKDVVAEGLAVAVVRVETDEDDQQMCFQASREQLGQLKSDIEETIKKMDLAEEWGRREPKA
jgi:hypothetical protein